MGVHGRACRVLALVSLVALACVGCGATGLKEYVHNGFKVGPDYGPPLAAVAPDWIDSESPARRRAEIPDGQWWSVFDDPTLTSLIERARAHNPSLRVVGARVLAARAGQAIASANLFPQSQTAVASYSRSQLNSNMPILDDLSKLSPDGLPLAFSNWFYGFNLNWELDLWGRIRRNIEANTANFEASVDDYDAALVTLFSDVATAYVQFRVAQQRLQITRTNVEVQEGILSIADQKFRVGTGTRLDVEQARTVLEQTRSAIPALEIAKGRANDTLCVLLGDPPSDLEPLLGPGPGIHEPPMPTLPDWVAAGIPADLLRRRPDIRASERLIAAQTAKIGVAEADLYPTFFINGTIGFDAADFSEAFANQSFLGLLFPTFKWNILNYGRIKNNIRLQQAKAEELIAAYQARVLSAGREVQVSLRGFSKSREEADAIRRSLDAAIAANNLGVEQYRAGTIDFNRVFNLETARVQEQDRLASAQGEIALNLIAVYRALGGGWENSAARAASAASAVLVSETLPASSTPPGLPEAADGGESSTDIPPPASTAPGPFEAAIDEGSTAPPSPASTGSPPVALP